MVGSGPTLPDRSSNRDAADLLDLAPAGVHGLASRLRDPHLPETVAALDHPWSVIADTG